MKTETNQLKAQLDRWGHFYVETDSGIIVTERNSDVYLSSLTTLPEGVKFENQGSVDLGAIQGDVSYLGATLNLRTVDGSTMAILSEHERDGINIAKAKYFQGGDPKNWSRAYVASRGNHTAHGDTIREAVEDVTFKYLRDTVDTCEIIAEVKKTQQVTRSQYRVLTGACRQGIQRFMDEHQISAETESLPLRQVLDLTANAYGGDKMRELFPPPRGACTRLPFPATSQEPTSIVSIAGGTSWHRPRARSASGAGGTWRRAADNL